MTENCICGNKLKTEEFWFEIVEYCDKCFNFNRILRSCEHEFIICKFEIADKQIILRNVCKKCNYSDNKSISKKGINLEMIKLRKLEDYKNHISKLEKPLFDFIKELQDKKNKGFRANYENYINSDEWKLKRKQALERDSYICQICGNDANEVHHLTYAHFKEEWLFELVSLCKACHFDQYTQNENI
jgi:hypothetical protein